MKDFLMSHYESRVNKPWNVWKTVRRNQFDQSDVSDDDDDDSSSEDENEKLARFLQTSRSDRRKTFEMWLTDKEEEMVRKQTEMAGKAKKDAIVKEKEANWRNLHGKTHRMWLEEKADFKNQEMIRGKLEQSEERKAEAIRKYQEWLRAKDEEALAREDRLRQEAAAKFTETKQKRDEKVQRAWYKKKLFDMF